MKLVGLNIIIENPSCALRIKVGGFKFEANSVLKRTVYK
jgi:hypothetical protein